MYPYFRLGPFTMGTYGFMMAIAFLCAWKVLALDIHRRNALKPRAEVVVFALAVAGITGSKLYHELETPTELLAQPLKIFLLTQGHAWFGGLLAGMLTLCFLAWYYKLSILTMMDIASPAAALGYAVGRLGCLLAGDGDYGLPTSLFWGMSFPYGLVPTKDYVHPTPIYEFIVGVAIFLCLWIIASRPRPAGWVFAQYLALTGAARFIIEFFRINPRIFFGLTNAQLGSLLCLICAFILLLSMNALPIVSRNILSKHISK